MTDEFWVIDFKRDSHLWAADADLAAIKGEKEKRDGEWLIVIGLIMPLIVTFIIASTI